MRRLATDPWHNLSLVRLKYLAFFFVLHIHRTLVLVKYCKNLKKNIQ